MTVYKPHLHSLTEWKMRRRARHIDNLVLSLEIMPIRMAIELHLKPFVMSCMGSASIEELSQRYKSP